MNIFYKVQFYFIFSDKVKVILWSVFDLKQILLLFLPSLISFCIDYFYYVWFPFYYVDWTFYFPIQLQLDSFLFSFFKSVTAEAKCSGD